MQYENKRHPGVAEGRLCRQKTPIAAREAEARSGNQLSLEECAGLNRRFEAEGSPSVLVVENPYAVHNLP